MDELQGGLEEVLRSPVDEGPLLLIVKRPRSNEREVVDEGLLDGGLVGDRGSSNPLMQLTLINSRAIQLVAREKGRWPLAGDQLYLDLDLSEANAPAGTRIAIGPAIVEVTAPPHLGCRKFMARYGKDALEFVNAPERRHLRLRGVNARVLQRGAIRVGELARKL